MYIVTVENTVVPTGEYLAEVLEITSETGNFGPQFKWKFEILKPEEYAGKALIGWTSQSPSVKGKFVRWASASLGKLIGPNTRVDLDDLIGRKVIVVVSVKEDEDGSEFNRIEGLKARKTEPAPEPEQAEEDDEDPF